MIIDKSITKTISYKIINCFSMKYFICMNICSDEVLSNYSQEMIYCLHCNLGLSGILRSNQMD